MKPMSVLLAIGGFSLALLAFSQDAEKKAISNGNLRLTQIAGKELFSLKKCMDCHTLGDTAEGKRTPVANKHSNEWFAAHVQKESPIVLREEKSARRQKRTLQDEIVALDDYLWGSKPEQKKQIDTMPENVFQGAYLAYQNNCLNCHKIAGFGKEIAPDLFNVGTKHDKKWFIANFKDPQQFNPESVMPKFDLLPEESLEKMADYLLSLK